MFNMERSIMKKQTCLQNSTPSSTTSSSSSLGFHKNSQTISKVKPKIRIIHIFAPEIIKTDVENFRELVQRLTGKPSSEDCCPAKKRMRIPRKEDSSRASTTAASSFTKKPVVAAAAGPVMKMELMRNGFVHSSTTTSSELLMRERIKGEEEIWRGANSGGGFLGSFHEFDGFMAELNEFPIPLLPLDANSHHMDAYGEPQLA